MNNFIAILSFLFLIACNTNNHKQQLSLTKSKKGIFITEETSLAQKFYLYLPDTNANPKSLKEFGILHRENYKRFDSFLNNPQFFDSSVNKISVLVKDSLQRLFQDNEEYINYKLLQYLPKNEINITFLSFISPYSNLISLEKYQDLFDQFPVSAQNSLNGKKAQRTINQYSFKNIGRNLKQITEFYGIDEKNKLLNIKTALNSKGNTLIVFGASWCGPCIKDELELLKNYSKIDKNIIVLGLSIDKQENDWRAYIDKYNIPWKSYVLSHGMNNEIIKFLDFDGIPRNYLVDENGLIIGEHTSFRYLPILK